MSTTAYQHHPQRKVCILLANISLSSLAFVSSFISLLLRFSHRSVSGRSLLLPGCRKRGFPRSLRAHGFQRRERRSSRRGLRRRSRLSRKSPNSCAPESAWILCAREKFGVLRNPPPQKQVVLLVVEFS